MKINRFFSPKQMTPEELKAHQDSQMKEASQAYEKYFLNEMVKAMKSTVHKEGGLIKENFAEKMFSENLDQEYVDGWSKSGGVGLADMIYQQLQESMAPPPQPRTPGPIELASRSNKTGAEPEGPTGLQKKGLEIYQKGASPSSKGLDD